MSPTEADAVSAIRQHNRRMSSTDDAQDEQPRRPEQPMIAPELRDDRAEAVLPGRAVR